jgi:Na+/H+-dicarboxylate symporter
MRSHVSMGLGLVAGLVLGLLAAATQNAALLAIARGLKPVGALFLNLLSMVVVPLVASAVFSGVAGLGDIRKVGRHGARALAFFWLTTIAGIAIGCVTAAVILPYGSLAPDVQTALKAAAIADSSVVRRAAELPSGTRFLVELVPANPVRSAADGNLLPLVLFVAILAMAAASLPEAKRRPLTELADATTAALIGIVRWVLLVAPLGIAALVAPTVAQFGWGIVRAMAVYVLTIVVGVAVLIGGVFLPAVALASQVRVARFLRAGFPSLLMGFSTTSSLATLPTMLTAAEGDLKIPPNVASLVLPLGASINRPGAALFQAVAVLFVAQLYGVHLGAPEMIQAGAAVFVTSLAVASVPAASVVSLAPALTATGLPLASLGMLMGLDRIPDMFRTMTNVAGHLAAATVIGARDGNTDGETPP